MDGSNSLLTGLSEPQKNAVLHRQGPLAVFAGAGSGKTRVITHRIAHLINSGVHPSSILALTFTNKAAGEMRSRVQQLVPANARSLQIATFHAMCARWLREFGSHLGFNSNFSIYDDSDSLAALKSVVSGMFPTSELAPLTAEMREFLNHAKIFGIFPDELVDNPLLKNYRVPTGAAQVYKEYQQYLQQCQAMDFGDLIMNLLLLLRRSKPVLEILSTRYQHILIDEFQDSNPSQLEIVETLSAKHRNLFVVGDDDQSIYSWRGANPSNLVHFHTRYPDAGRIILAENFRSTKNIIEAANALIQNNKQRVEKILYSNVPEGPKINYRQEADGELEAWYIADCIKRDLSKFHYSDFAIFYRTNSQSRLIEEALRREQIPYRVFGSVKFYDRMEVKDIIGYLRLIVNESDDVSLERVLNVPGRGIGDKAEVFLKQAARESNQPLLATLRGLVRSNAGKAAAKFGKFLDIFDEMRREIAQVSLAEAVSVVVKCTDYHTYLKKKYPALAEDKIQNVHELAAAMSEFARRASSDPTIADWLQTVTLSKDAEGDEEQEEGVSLMTLHTAKGLEYPSVFIIGAENGFIPHRNSQNTASDLEEERRLFYVGITRAREQLTITSAASRMVFGEFMANSPSMFLQEMPSSLINMELSAAASPLHSSSSYLDDQSVSYDFDLDREVQVGATVSHPVYGRGVIESLSQQGLKKAVVRFREIGTRVVPVSHLSSLA